MNTSGPVKARPVRQVRQVFNKQTKRWEDEDEPSEVTAIMGSGRGRRAVIQTPQFLYIEGDEIKIGNDNITYSDDGDPHRETGDDSKEKRPHKQRKAKAKLDATKNEEPEGKRKRLLSDDETQFPVDDLKSKATNIPITAVIDIFSQPLESLSERKSSDGSTCEVTDSAQDSSSAPAPTPTARGEEANKELCEDEHTESRKSVMQKLRVSAMHIRTFIEDEWDCYGKQLAAKLRNMPSLDRSTTIKNIDAIVENKSVEIASRP